MSKLFTRLSSRTRLALRSCESAGAGMHAFNCRRTWAIVHRCFQGQHSITQPVLSSCGSWPPPTATASVVARVISCGVKSSRRKGAITALHDPLPGP